MSWRVHIQNFSVAESGDFSVILISLGMQKSRTSADRSWDYLRNSELHQLYGARRPVLFSFKDWDIMTDKTKQAVESVAGGIPVCHPEMDDLHADMSSAAAEVYAASVALGEFLHLSYVEDEMGFGTIRPIVINVDNTTAIAFSENSTKRSKMRHIDCRQLWVQALRDRGLCKLVKVSTDDNESDLFTKILGPIRFEFLRD